MSKDWDVFTDDEMLKMLVTTFIGRDFSLHDAKTFNRNLSIGLQERGQVGYALRIYDDIVINIKERGLHTKEALVFLRPIEEEVEECDHKLEGAVGWSNWEVDPDTDHPDYNFCPKCGADLR